MLLQNWLNTTQSWFKTLGTRRAIRRRQAVARGTACEVFEARSYPAATLAATLGSVTGTSRPLNDAPATATPLYGSSVTATGTNVGATKQAGEPNHADNVGGHSVWWKWTAPANGSVSIDTSGSNFDTTLGVYTGSSVSRLRTIASDDDGGGNHTSRVTFNAVAGTSYFIAVDGWNGATGNITLNVRGSVSTNPVIQVRGGSGSTITAGDTTPQTEDGTDLGSARSGSGFVIKTFTITNIGTAVLNINSRPAVSGNNASDFSIAAIPSTSIAIGESTTFQIRFQPGATSTGTRSATITIPNNDPTKNPFTFAVRGTATAVAGTQISVTGPGGLTIPPDGVLTSIGLSGNVSVGTSADYDFTITNSGNSPLSLTGTSIVSVSGSQSAAFSVIQPTSRTVGVGGTTTFRVRFTPTVAGPHSAAFSIANNSTNGPNVMFNLGVNAVAPEVTVAVSPSRVMENGNTNLVYTFTRTGDTSRALTFSFILAGTATYFTDYYFAPDTSLATVDRAISSTEFSCRATIPAGASSATIRILPRTDSLNGEPDETVTISIIPGSGYSTTQARTAVGTIQDAPVLLPNIRVQGRAEILSGDITPSIEEGTDFGSPLTINGLPGEVIRYFTVSNSGTAPLELTGAATISISGTNASSFRLISQPARSISAGYQATFQVNYQPNAGVTGEQTATISISNNSPNAPAFTFRVKGSWIEPTPAVSVSVSPNRVTENGTNNLVYTFTRTGATTYPLTVSFSLSGSALPSIDYRGDGDTDWTSQGNDYTLVIPANSRSTDVSIRPLIDSVIEFDELVVFTLHSAEGYIVGVDSTATGTIQDSTILAQPQIQVTSGEGTDFGNVTVGASSVRSFTITNQGTGSLSLTGLTIGGSSAFTIMSPSSSFIASGASATFQVRFSPIGTGGSVATISIANNSVNAPSFMFNVSGTGVAAAPTGAFQIEFQGSATFDWRIQQALSEAGRIWERVITNDLSDVWVGGIRIDDLRIDVTLANLATGALAEAAPTEFRQGSSLPYRGFIRIAASSIDNPNLVRILAHEIGHVLGLGTLWQQFGLTRTYNGQPYYYGSNAVAQYNRLFGTTSVNALTLETVGGAGSVGSHWAEAVFDTELMTSEAENGSMPLSAMTIGALADLGYQVNYNAAEAYGPFGASILAPRIETANLQRVLPAALAASEIAVLRLTDTPLVIRRSSVVDLLVPSRGDVQHNDAVDAKAAPIVAASNLVGSGRLEHLDSLMARPDWLHV